MCRQLQKYKHINQYYFWNVHNHRVLGVFDGTNVGVRTHLRSSRGRERGTRRRGGAVLIKMNTNKTILRKSADDEQHGRCKPSTFRTYKDMFKLSKLGVLRRFVRRRRNNAWRVQDFPKRLTRNFSHPVFFFCFAKIRMILLKKKNICKSFFT